LCSIRKYLPRGNGTLLRPTILSKLKFSEFMFHKTDMLGSKHQKIMKRKAFCCKESCSEKRRKRKLKMNAGEGERRLGNKVK